MKKLLKIVLGILAALLALAVLLIGVLTLTEYRPADTETLAIENNRSEALPLEQPLTLLIWNIGYSALGDNADFFMDGGSMVQTADRDRVVSNMQHMAARIRELSPDLCFLQEVDRNSGRSYGIDQRYTFLDALENHAMVFACNFNSLYVPYPLPPIGHVESGILSFSRTKIDSAVRLQLPCPFSWPLRIANLKRCLLVTRLPISGSDKELVAINLHLEAYDDGAGKIAQTEQLAALLRAEVAKGNYVIAGGDFNQVFSGTDTGKWPLHEGMWTPGRIEESQFGEGFRFLMDDRIPSCRSLDKPLSGADLEDFQFYAIDGFIVSDNVQVTSAEVLDEGFVYSDHNPLLLRFTLTE